MAAGTATSAASALSHSEHSHARRGGSLTPYPSPAMTARGIPPRIRRRHGSARTKPHHVRVAHARGRVRWWLAPPPSRTPPPAPPDHVAGTASTRRQEPPSRIARRRACDLCNAARDAEAGGGGGSDTAAPRQLAEGWGRPRSGRTAARAADAAVAGATHAAAVTPAGARAAEAAE